MQEQKKYDRPDKYLNRNMPERVKKLSDEHRAGLRKQQRAEFKRQMEEKK